MIYTNIIIHFVQFHLKLYIRAYYSVEDDYAAPDFKSLYADQGIQKAQSKTPGLAVETYEYGLSNFPNPFNPTTQVSYQLKESGHVTIKVYDALGKEVANLVDEVKPSGKYNVTFNGAELSSGIYFISMRVNNFYKTQKIILAK